MRRSEPLRPAAGRRAFPRVPLPAGGARNANVAAGVTLAGPGFDRTRVPLMVDAAATGNQHAATAKGPFGEISTRVVARTLPQNPKTSTLALT